MYCFSFKFLGKESDRLFYAMSIAKYTIMNNK